MRRLIALASLLALVAVACKIETNFAAVINADGSGTITFEIGMDDEAQSFLGDLLEDPFQDTDLVDLPGARQRTERRGDLDYWILEADVADITAFQDLAGDESMLDTLSITITDERVTVRGTASADDAFGGGEDFDLALFEDSVSANVRITMPGAILSHNADSQRGNELTWQVPVVEGTLDIQAESDPRGTPADPDDDGGGIPIWLIVAIAAAVLLVALYFLNRRRASGAVGSPDEGIGAPAPPADE